MHRRSFCTWWRAWESSLRLCAVSPLSPFCGKDSHLLFLSLSSNFLPFDWIHPLTCQVAVNIHFKTYDKIFRQGKKFEPGKLKKKLWDTCLFPATLPPCWKRPWEQNLPNQCLFIEIATFVLEFALCPDCWWSLHDQASSCSSGSRGLHP